MDIDRLYPSRFIKAGLFDGKDVTMKIANVEIEELEGDKDEKEKKVVMTFEGKNSNGKPVQLILNKTNATCIRHMFGRETNAWIGKRVTFFPKEESYGDTDLCIRVRGSPDIPAPISIDTKIGRRRLKVTLQKTTVAAKGAAPAANGQSKPTSALPAAPATPPAPAVEEAGPPDDVFLPTADGRRVNGKGEEAPTEPGGEG